MENKTKNGIVVTLIFLGVGYFLYKSMNKKLVNQGLVDKIWAHMVSKNLVLASNPQYKESYQITINGQPLGYLNDWVDAIDKNEQSFIYNLVTYNTDNGVGI